MQKILIFLLLVISDIVSKYFVFNYIDLYQFIKITYFFDITHIHNFGVSFGLFSGTISPLYLIVIGLLVVFFIIYLFSSWILESSQFCSKCPRIFCNISFVVVRKKRSQYFCGIDK